MSGDSVIGPRTAIRGKLQGAVSLRVLGQVDGSITGGNVSLAEGAQVRGEVAGVELSIAGKVEGDLEGIELVLVENGARIVGDVTAPRIGIAPGGLVRGLVRTESEPAPREPERGRAAPGAPVESGRARPESPQPTVPARRTAEAAPERWPSRLDRPPAPVPPALRRGAKAKTRKRKS